MEKNKGLIPWEQIRGWMASTQITQSELARRMNVATSVVTNWKMRGGAPYARATEIAQAFHIPVAELLQGKSKREGMSAAGQKLVSRVMELDRSGGMTRDIEAALHAVLDIALKRKN